MKKGFIGKILKILGLFTIGFISVTFYLLKSSARQVFIPQGEINATEYGIGLYEASGEFFLLGSPLNDFYYRGSSKNHLLDKVAENKSEGLLREFLIEVKDLFLNEKGVGLIFKGKNHEGNGEINYKVRYFGNKIEIEREIALDKNFDAIGQAIIICPGCFVTDDKNRIYLNQEFLTQDTVDFAAKMNLTLLVIGENQFFPTGSSKIVIRNKNGEIKMQVPVYPNEQISLQENWHLLEFRMPVKSAGHVRIKQVIYL